MKKIALIGGTGLSKMEGLQITSREAVSTEYGKPSSDLIIGELYGQSIVFLARHGEDHSIAPHKINYRANIMALKSLGVEQIIAIGAVGGIGENCSPTTVIVPEQIIDYTYGREHTFYDGGLMGLDHIGFSYPYTQPLRDRLIQAAMTLDIPFIDHGTYGITQGPRLETAAEIKRMRQDGCTLVGMTGMPEAALAREARIDYAALTMVVNWAAGMETEEIDFSAVEAFIKQGTQNVEAVLKAYITNFCQ